MKKRIALVFLALVLVFTTLCTAGCDSLLNNLFGNDTPGGNTNTPPVDGNVRHVTSSDVINTFETKYFANYMGSKPYEEVESFIRNGCYYYCLKVGEVENVIVNAQSFEYNAMNTYSRTYTISKVTTASLQTQNNRIVQRLEYDNHFAGGSLELGITENFKFGRSEQFYSDTTTTTDSNSTTETNEETISESYTVTVSFDSSCPEGYYRLCNIVDCAIFVLIQYDPSTEQIAYEYVSKGIKGTSKERMQYSQTDFPRNNDIDFSAYQLLDLKQTVLELGVPKDNQAVFSGGNGSAQNPYQITTAEQFLSIMDYSDKHFVLKNDINIGSMKAPLGKNYWEHSAIDDAPEDPFTGTLDGNGYTVSYNMMISNLEVVKTDLEMIMGFHKLCTKDYSFGLFAAAKNATFRNLVVDAKIDCPRDGKEICRELCVGGLVGFADNVVFADCKTTETSNIVNYYTDGAFYERFVGHRNTGATLAGGLVGDARNCEFRTCETKATVYAMGYFSYAGGIAGSMYNCNCDNATKDSAELNKSNITSNGRGIGSFSWSRTKSGSLCGKNAAPDKHEDGAPVQVN